VRTPRWLTTARVGTALAVTGAMVAGTLAVPPAGAATDTATVTYRGVSVTVPAAWPVLHLDGQQGCVRFDRHAVYLGDPASSSCPAVVTGHVEAVHLTDGVVSDARSPLADLGAGREITGGTAIHPDLVVSHQKSPVRVVVTSGAQPDVAQQVADSVAFSDTSAAAKSFSSNSSTSPTASSSTSSNTPAPAPALRAAKVPATYTGLGFDTCVTPSTSAMAAWTSDPAAPYRAVNMYIGGASRGCATQTNLTPSWVNTVVGAGWTLIPTYVGLQAPCADPSRFTHRIQASSAAAQGTVSADDAIAVLNNIGLGAGSIVYFDMEAYDGKNASCVASVQTFLDAWTVRLHSRDYLSGVYTSSVPMKPTLVDRLSDATFHQPDDIWFARWNGDPSIVGDPEIPDTAWPTHQRIHQYMGGHIETYGGVTINIDNNSLDADTSPGAPLVEGTFLSESGSAAVYRIAGGAPLYVSSWAGFGGAQPVLTVSKTRFRLLPTYPRDGTFLQSATRPYIFRVQGAVASAISSWDPYGGPQPTTVVDDAALDKAGAGGVWNHLISAKPAVAMTGPSTSVRLSPSGFATWAPAIRSSAARDYEVRYRRAKWNSTFGALVVPKSWQHTSPTTRSLGLARGYDYCVSVRARNWAGQVTGWSSERCLTRPLDDRSLAASAGWNLGKGPNNMAGTFRGTTRKGATLRVSSARIKRVGVVATTCASCGKVAVLVDGKRVGTVNLHSASTHRKTLLMLPAFSRRTGDVMLKVQTSGLRVQIDGLALSRT
jgi:Domain of unknown function (DUF1906)